MLDIPDIYNRIVSLQNINFLYGPNLVSESELK
jgi:hypothetical protein